MPTWVKLGIIGVLLGGGSALLAVSIHRARVRGHLSHCRNNLRRLGELAMGYIELDSGRRDDRIRLWEEKVGRGCGVSSDGRGFWQAVRFYEGVDNRGNWKWVRQEGEGRYPNGLNPFDCPLNGSAGDMWRSKETIDYLGPCRFPAPGAQEVILGRDRDGNHGSEPGFILTSDLRVGEVRVLDGDHDDSPLERARKETCE